jgi:hypothetical protein
MLDEEPLIRAAKSAHRLATMTGHETIKLTELSDSTVVYNPDESETEWIQFWPDACPDGHAL